MIDPARTILIHGLMGSSQGKKAIYLRGLYPGMLVPDFHGTVEERMSSLEDILEVGDGWRIIGSSLGGLMGAMYTCQHPERVKKLVLMAPALIWPAFTEKMPEPVSVPVVLYHGRQDELIPLNEVRAIAEQVFTNLAFIEVDDDHGLYKTLQEIDWDKTLGDG
jgi:pimeloyl-ACP methyl ester carboxylesterase